MRGREVLETVDAQLAEDEQAQAVIDDLERRNESEDLPTSEELGAAFERFLAERARRPDDQPL